MLDGMAAQSRGARWYYYSAITHYRMGNQSQALEHAKQAVSWSRTIWSTGAF